MFYNDMSVVLSRCVCLCALDSPQHRHPFGVARSVPTKVSLGFCFVCGLCCLSPCLVFDLNVVCGCVP